MYIETQKKQLQRYDNLSRKHKLFVHSHLSDGPTSFGTSYYDTVKWTNVRWKQQIYPRRSKWSFKHLHHTEKVIMSTLQLLFVSAKTAAHKIKSLQIYESIAQLMQLQAAPERPREPRFL